MKLRFIGDVHGMLDRYVEFVRDADLSISLGEMGFRPLQLYSYYEDGQLDPDKHIILPGNHDNYQVIPGIRTFLCDPGWGVHKGGPFPEFFYVRGAESVPWDRIHRVEGKDWWPQEQLSYGELEKAVEAYRAHKPKLMITHTCPQRLVERLVPPGNEIYKFRTELALDEMFASHKPDIWLFGHFHHTEIWEQDGTKFVALGELATADMDVSSGEISNLTQRAWR